MDDPQESANERRHEQVEAVEEILEAADPALEEHAYPVTSEELAARYGSTNAELPNETESLGSVFDRLDDREFDSPMAVKEELLRAASDALPEPPNAGDGRSPEADHGGTPPEVLDDLESEAVAESTREEDPTDVDPASGGVGTTADTASGPETDAAAPEDELTPDTTEDGEFAPLETVEDRDREGERSEPADRASGDVGAASREGESSEPSEPADRASSAEGSSADREASDASEASRRARYDGDDEEPLEGTAEEELRDSPVPDAREEDRDVTREGNLPDEEEEPDGE